MYFHIDESGNTGNNLFDPNQPRLSYGLLSSKTNADALGAPIHQAMLAKLGVKSLHASPLGMGRLEEIAPHLNALHRKMNFEFGLFVIEKRTYALVHLFEAIFDAGLNEAVPWSYYWTPLRFYLIHHLDQLVDDDLLQHAWRLSIDRRIDRRFGEVVELLSALDQRLQVSGFDARIKEVMRDALRFGMNHPDRLDFGATDPLLVSPNAVGFQFVFAEIAAQLRRKSARSASVIAIDHQQQFNAAQKETHRMQELIAKGLRRAPEKDRNYIINHPLYRHLSRDEVLPPNLPGVAPQVWRNTASIGLQITDIYLWVMNRALSGEELPPGLGALANSILPRMRFDGIWMDGMRRRWTTFEQELPSFEHLTSEQLKSAQVAMDAHRAKVASIRTTKPTD